MHIILVRHGHIRKNTSRFSEGWYDPDLSSLGESQADRTGLRLASLHIQAIFSSDLIRAKQTANIINQHLNLPMRLLPELREIFMGDWEGRSFRDLEIEKDEYYLSWSRHETDMPYPNGESGADVLRRTMGFLDNISQMDLKNIVVITHGGVIRALVSTCIQLDMQSRFHLPVSTCGLTHLVYSPSLGYYLHYLNDTSHLDQALPIPE